MADIPVEKDSSSSWWKWLLALLVLILLIWLFFEIFNDEGDDNVNDTSVDTEQVEPGANAGMNGAQNGMQNTAGAAAAGGLITSIATLTDADDPQQLAGRQVQLSDMRVTGVVGDSAFYATSQQGSGDRRFLVALDEQMHTPQDQSEGRYDVTEGQIVSIDGRVRATTGREGDAWGLSQEEMQGLQNDQIYLRAQSLTVTDEASQ